MRKHQGAWWLAIGFVFLLGHLSVVTTRGLKLRIKWNRKALPSTAHVVTEARVADIRPGAFIKHGQKLDIDFGTEGNRYYEANYWQLPDGIHYEGCSEANVTREAFIAGCINATQAANQEELARDGRLHQRVLWRLIRELCALKRCDFWQERGAGLQLGLDQPVMLCLLACVWLLLK
ncbi:PREDICTED: prion-like protein doppel [Elephantulus edwardii]|uniref:prion-like protein doppel n=1 Tax=Elephantulus edwardii TaxID=28737 RepID=UPI0003F088CA|nr:PREDICTED: prion-like protein doppel [Elephantulus edwardii]